MKKIAACFLLILFSTSIYSQTVNWMKGPEENFESQIIEIATDLNGNSYAAGYFREIIQINGLKDSTASGNYKMLVQKYDSTGQLLWSRAEGESSGMYPYSVSYDQAGNSYICGNYFGILKFKSTTYPEQITTNGFIAKFDLNGNPVWLKTVSSINSNFTSTFYKTKTDANNNIYAFGSYSQGNATFGDTTLPNYSNEGNAVLVKYNPSGDVIWARTFPSLRTSWFSAGYGMDIDNQNNIYFFGKVSNPFIDNNGTSEYNDDVFFGKMNSKGKLIWFKSDGIANNDEFSYSIKVSGNSFLIIMGFYGDSTILAGHKYFGLPGLTYQEHGRVLAKYDTSGANKWGRLLFLPTSATSYLQSNNLANDDQENIYAYGSFHEGANFIDTSFYNSGQYDLNLYLLIYNSSGTFIRGSTFGTEQTEYGTSLGIDASNNLYFSGFYIDSTEIGGIKLKSSGPSYFIAKANAYYSPTNPTGIINSYSLYEPLTVYPNPVVEKHKVSLLLPKPGYAHLNLLDQMGRSILVISKMTDPQGKLDLDISQCTNGMYILQVSTEEQFWQKKVVIVD